SGWTTTLSQPFGESLLALPWSSILVNHLLPVLISTGRGNGSNTRTCRSYVLCVEKLDIGWNKAVLFHRLPNLRKL
ncbi:hypothetical protein LINPERHAP2_LOCUS43282, partial [Linum perenne]